MGSSNKLLKNLKILCIFVGVNPVCLRSISKANKLIIIQLSESVRRMHIYNLITFKNVLIQDFCHS